MTGDGKDTVIQNLYGTVKLNISVSACYSFLNRHCLDEQGKRGQNVPLLYNCANSIGAAN
jgi:hypothetical protein